MSFPEIESKRITLRELNEDDSASLFEVFSDERAMKYWDSEIHKDIAVTIHGLRHMKSLWYSQQGVSWGILLKQSQEIIGQCSFHSWNIYNKESQLGYIINPKYWGMGLGCEVLRLVVNFGFNELGLKTILAEIDPDNIPSSIILEKNGFILIETKKNDLKTNNVYHDTNIYKLSNVYA